MNVGIGAGGAQVTAQQAIWISMAPAWFVTPVLIAAAAAGDGSARFGVAMGTVVHWHGARSDRYRARELAKLTPGRVVLDHPNGFELV